MNNQTMMSDREAFYIAIHTLLSEAISAFETNQKFQVPTAMKQLYAANALLENELKFIDKMKKENEIDED